MNNASTLQLLCVLCLVLASRGPVNAKQDLSSPSLDNLRRENAPASLHNQETSDFKILDYDPFEQYNKTPPPPLDPSTLSAAELAALARSRFDPPYDKPYPAELLKQHLAPSLASRGLQFNLRTPNYSEECRNRRGNWYKGTSIFNKICDNDNTYQQWCEKHEENTAVGELPITLEYGFRCHAHEFCMTSDLDDNVLDPSDLNAPISLKALCVELKWRQVAELPPDNMTRVLWYASMPMHLPLGRRMTYMVTHISTWNKNTGFQFDWLVGPESIPMKALVKFKEKDVSANQTAGWPELSDVGYRVADKLRSALKFQSKVGVQGPTKQPIYIRTSFGWS